MILTLPPKATCSSSDWADVYSSLSSVVAFGPSGLPSYQFYQEIEDWLGPWGVTGYPIGYGKKYNIKFESNLPLMRDMYGRNWVHKTTQLLQMAIRDYLVNQVRIGTLSAITEPILRAAAFGMHAKAYVDGGLLAVAENSPELFLVIVAIPSEEFVSANWVATFRQVITVMTLSGLKNLFRTALGMHVRSNPLTIIIRLIWEEITTRVPGLVPLPPVGSRDDDFWDKLGFIGGVANVMK